MRKSFKWVGIACLCPIVLFILLAILLYIPPIQNYIVEKVTAYATESTGMYIHVDRIKLAFPLNIVVKGVEVVSEQDTILTVDHVGVDVQLLPLLWQKVEIDGIILKNAKVNTADLMESMKLKASLGEFYLSSHGIELSSERAVLNEAYLKNADIHLCFNDTIVEEEDTVSEPMYWKVDLQKIALQDVSFAMQLDDTTSMATSIKNAELLNGYLDLKEESYRVNNLVLKDGTFTYDTNDLQPQSGLDASHIALSGIQIELDSINYCGQDMALSIVKMGAKERSGLNLISLTGKLESDAKSLRIPKLSMQTLDSFVNLIVDMDWDALEPGKDGTLSARLLAELGKQDIMTFMGEMPEAFVKEYPNVPLVMRAGVDGNVDELRITGLQTQLEGAIHASMQGSVTNALDSISRSGSLTFKSETQDLSFITALVDSTNSGSIVLPAGMILEGTAGVEGERYTADLVFKEGNGLSSLLASYHGTDESYNVELDVDRLQIHDFMPLDSIYSLSANISVKGSGTDIYSSDMYLDAQAVLDTLQYGEYNLSDVSLAANMQNGKVQMTLDSNNPLLRMSSQLNGHLGQDDVSGKLVVNVREADLYEMRLVDSLIKTSGILTMDVESDWEQTVSMHGSLANMGIVTTDKTYEPKNVYFDAFSRNDSTYMKLNSGDFILRLAGRTGLETMINNLNDLSLAMLKQMDEKVLDLNSLKGYFPELSVRLSLGEDNPINNFLATQGIEYNRLFLDLGTSPIDGINGNSYLYTMRMDSLNLDTLRLNISQDENGIKFFTEVKNAPTNKQFVFDATLQGIVDNKGVKLELKYVDEEQKTGVHLGVGVDLESKGLRCFFFPAHPIIAYKPFNLNRENYVYLYKDGQIEAKLDLLNNDGMGMRLYSTPNEKAFRDLTLQLSKIDIGEILQALPYMPDVTGILTSEVHYVEADELMSVYAETSIDSLTYEKNLMGNIANSLTYLPKDQVTHSIDTRLARDGSDFFMLDGDYKDVDDGVLDLKMKLKHLPLDIVNGFIPDQMVAMKGGLDGSLDVKGTTARPVVNGSVALDSVFMSSDMYGIRFRFDNRPVNIENSCMTFDKFNICTKEDNPFTIDGKINFANLDKIALDLRMRASEYELLNAPHKRESVVYGKVYVDFFSSLRGTLDNIMMRGNLTVLGKTDVAYVMKESPLVVEDRLSDLVTFVDFNDTVKVDAVDERIYNISGIDLLLNLQVEQGAEMRVDLNTDGTNYLELLGGGNLTLQYTQQGDLLLTGRYTLTSGEMKYELPIIPLKTFTIKNGSYVEFSGKPMNPYMNITATERVRASVTENESSRTVAFDVGVAITNTLENMGLEFTLEAPEDMTVQNELTAMSKEDRGKLAVAMLATGMYLNEGSGGFSANSALNSFLQSEISSIAGSALKTVDISIGMEDATSSDGSTHTDYSFRFAKRFWNNRLSVVIGGTISSGNDAAESNDSESFIDDISLEWRLDDSGTRYIRLFHNKNYESILEGEITETGVGVVLRRKMTKFGELFIFKKKKNKNKNREEVPKT